MKYFRNFDEYYSHMEAMISSMDAADFFNFLGVSADELPSSKEYSMEYDVHKHTAPIYNYLDLNCA